MGDIGRPKDAFGSCPARRFAQAGLRWCGGWRRTTSEDLMTKPKSRPKASTRSTAQKTAKPAARRHPAATSSKPRSKSDTKHARIIAMLQSPAGATVARMMSATDWQQHSVRGFLAGVVRKKLGLNLVSEVTDKGRIYRIKDGAASAGASRAKQAA